MTRPGAVDFPTLSTIQGISKRRSPPPPLVPGWHKATSSCHLNPLPSLAWIWLSEVSQVRQWPLFSHKTSRPCQRAGNFRAAPFHLSVLSHQAGQFHFLLDFFLLLLLLGVLLLAFLRGDSCSSWTSSSSSSSIICGICSSSSSCPSSSTGAAAAA